MHGHSAVQNPEGKEAVMPQWPGVSGLLMSNGSPFRPSVAAPSPAWMNMPPTTTGVQAPIAGVSRPALNILGNWIPSSNEFQIWIAPAGWAEAAYLNGEKIDGEDPLSFMDKLEGVEEINVRSECKMHEVFCSGFSTGLVPGKPVVTLTLGGHVVVNEKDKYSKVFPTDGTRVDVVIQATHAERGQPNKLRQARAVIANAMMTERELQISAGNSPAYESLTLVGDGYFPIVEPQ